MNKYFIFNNQKSTEYGLFIEDRVLYPSSLNNNDKVIELNVYYYSKNRASHITQFRAIQNWLDNIANLQFQEDIEGFYKVNKTEINIRERRANSIHLTIKFTVEQYRYLKSQSEFINLIIQDDIEEYTIDNLGDNKANPVFIIDSTGDITLNINNKVLTIKNTNGRFILDSELQDCYNDKQLLNNNLIGEFPILNIGINSLKFTGNIKSIKVRINSTIY